MFRDAKVGDRVWSVEYGWGTIDHITLGPRADEMLPGSGPKVGLHIKFDDFTAQDYTIDGRWRGNKRLPTLFWDEVKIVPPPRPRRKVKKVVEGWICLHQVFSDRIGKSGCVASTNLWPTKEEAFKAGWGLILGDPIHISHEFEVEE